MDEEKTDQTNQTDQQDQNLQEEHLVVRIVNATCTCDAMSEQDYRCQNLPNCVFKTN